ncbi:MAG: DEAD/DEAH box helicase [Victivallales bacterium]
MKKEYRKCGRECAQTEEKFHKTTGWLTDDEYEIRLRRHRAETEDMSIKKLDGFSGIFADYTVSRKDSEKPTSYTVELRSQDSRTNFCTCPDFKKNFLGTCKHIEKILLKENKKIKSKDKSPFVEIFLEHSGFAIQVRAQVPDSSKAKTMQFISKFFDVNGDLNRPADESLMAFSREVQSVDGNIRKSIRISRGVREYAVELARKRELELRKSSFLDEMKSGRRSADIVKFPLYDYQVQGMIFLAFTGRAMLADEMGLGKTVQAVAACKLLKETSGVSKTLIVCPTSLKSEWEEQIRKFTDLPLKIVAGGRKERLLDYECGKTFFFILNYEQIVRDEHEINEILRPDVIILDEAQRIKNWRTKTASAVKKLRSDYAFVLTGTPIENRIDELFSLTEFVDPKIFGSLFRFNRQFYDFDGEGKTVGIKNMRLLHEQLKPVMIRRRKTDISEQLPERIDNNYFVGVTLEQRKRYDENEYQVSILLRIAQKRPLREEEMKKLQRLLACMRMLCDSVFILDKKIKDAPKVDELFKILDDIWSDEPDRKVIIFSEWVGMLDLVKERLEDKDTKYALHTGSVRQDLRREEINRFKNDKECRVFLSTDSGGVGLNLQAASVVVNLDLPWNPAKLEQRISRAWRKHQKNSVNVINIIAENTIEHRMLATLDFKKEIASGVLDPDSSIDNLHLQTSRKQFMERLEKILGTDFAKSADKRNLDADGTPVQTQEESLSGTAILAPPYECARQDLLVRFNDGIFSFKADVSSSGHILKALVIIQDRQEAQAGNIISILREYSGETPVSRLNVVTRSNYEAMLKLAESGLITLNDSGMKDLIVDDSIGRSEKSDAVHRKEIAESIMKKADRKIKMAEYLNNGGFSCEAIPASKEFLDFAGRALMVITSKNPFENEPASFDPVFIQIFRERGLLDEDLCWLFKIDLSLITDDKEANAIVRKCAKLNDLVHESLIKSSF